ncbi:MAG: short-chain dehydrogenase [Longimicrobiales bacterium]
MQIHGSTVLILGGAGLVGQAVARRVLEQGPGRVVIASLREAETAPAVQALSVEFPGTAIEGHWGDLFVPFDMKDLSREQIRNDDRARGSLIEDIYSQLSDPVFDRSTLGRLLTTTKPDAVVDCINTAGALAYQNVFASAAQLRAKAKEGNVGPADVEQHLSTLYLPQLIRHTQILLRGLREAGTQILVKVGTAGTGGMGLNIPFTHSEERPSRVLLAKSGLAGAQTLLLYLMARTPGGPAVKEVKPTAAISWKSIGVGPVPRGGKTMTRSDALRPVPLSEAFEATEGAFTELDQAVDGVYLDAGENGVFSLSEFEALTALGLMEFVTPEEIAENVVREIRGHPTGADVVAALDAATMGPTYRAGVLRSEAIGAMEALEASSGLEGIAYEMLGPPRLTKLLFEGHLLGRLCVTLARAEALVPEDFAKHAAELLHADADLRQRILSCGLPILLPQGDRLLRGATVLVAPERPSGEAEPKIVDAGWVDLRAENWAKWRDRCGQIVRELEARPPLESGSAADHDHGDRVGRIRPGHLAAWIFRTEDQGLRIKR